MTKPARAVAPFPGVTFRNFAELEAHLAATDAERGLRWLYERSLATVEKTVSLEGVCGLCLTPTTFTAATRGGELAPNGRVPNWREELVCGCERRLNNRQRALLHFIAAEGLLQPWTRVLLMGDAAALRPYLEAAADQVTTWAARWGEGPETAPTVRGGYHLALSVEQLSGPPDRQVVSRLAEVLAPQATLVGSAPFDIAAWKPSAEGDSGGWDYHKFSPDERLSLYGRACLYWSEEFGYMGAFNLIWVCSLWGAE